MGGIMRKVTSYELRFEWRLCQGPVPLWPKTQMSATFEWLKWPKVAASAVAQMPGGNNYQLVCKSAKLPMEGKTFTALNVRGRERTCEPEPRMSPATPGPLLSFLWQKDALAILCQFSAPSVCLWNKSRNRRNPFARRSHPMPFAPYGGRWTDSWLSGRAITLFLVANVSILFLFLLFLAGGDCHWNREFGSNWQTSRKQVKLFTIFRALFAWLLIW